MGDVCYEVILRLYEENTIYALFARDTIALSQSLGLSVTVRGMQMLVAMQVCDLFFLPSKKKTKVDRRASIAQDRTPKFASTASDSIPETPMTLHNTWYQ